MADPRATPRRTSTRWHTLAGTEQSISRAQRRREPTTRRQPGSTRRRSTRQGRKHPATGHTPNTNAAPTQHHQRPPPARPLLLPRKQQSTRAPLRDRALHAFTPWPPPPPPPQAPPRAPRPRGATRPAFRCPTRRARLAARPRPVTLAATRRRRRRLTPRRACRAGAACWSWGGAAAAPWRPARRHDGRRRQSPHRPGTAALHAHRRRITGTLHPEPPAGKQRPRRASSTEQARRLLTSSAGAAAWPPGVGRPALPPQPSALPAHAAGAASAAARRRPARRAGRPAACPVVAGQRPLVPAHLHHAVEDGDVGRLQRRLHAARVLKLDVRHLALRAHRGREAPASERLSPFLPRGERCTARRAA